MFIIPFNMKNVVNNNHSGLRPWSSAYWIMRYCGKKKVDEVFVVYGEEIGSAIHRYLQMTCVQANKTNKVKYRHKSVERRLKQTEVTVTGSEQTYLLMKPTEGSEPIYGT